MMVLPNSKCVSLFVTFAVLNTLAFADKGESKIQKQFKNAQRTELIIKPSLPVHHIPLQDATGREMAPNELIRLTNGKQVLATEYFASLNKLEAAMNAKGYSIYSGPAIEKVGHVVTDFSAANAIQASLDSLAKKASSMAPSVNTRTFPGCQLTIRDWKASWAPHVGSFGLNMSFENESSAYTKLTKNPQTSDLIGMGEKLSGSVTATVMSNDFPLMAVIAESNLGGTLLQPNNSQPSIEIGLQIGGQNVWGIQRKPTDPLVLKGSQSFPFDLNADATFDIAGIIIVGKAGVIGSAGYSYDAGVEGLQAHANGEAYVKASAYAQAGVGLGFEVSNYGVGVDGGIKMNLLLIDEKLDAGASVTFAQQNNKFGIRDQLTITNNLNALQGNVDAYIHANAGPVDKEFDFPLFDWPGFKQNAKLVNQNDFVPLLSK
jgi:hypothetical protein